VPLRPLVTPLTRLPVTLLVCALLAAGCAAPSEDPPVGPSRAAPVVPRAAPGEVTSAPLVLVLPAASTLHPAEHARLLVAADRALAEAAADGPARRVVLPREGALDDVAAALAPDVGVLCAVGSGAVEVLASVRERRPRLVTCAVPAPAGADGVAGIDVDLAGLGVRLGAAARTAAGPAPVAVLASGDPLLGAAWLDGVIAGAAGDGLAEVRLVTGAAGLAAALAAGAGAVVLDAGPAAAAALAVLATVDVPVLLPAALADAPGGPDPDRVAARYRVRWDLALAPLLRRVRGVGVPDPAPAALTELEPGPAARPPVASGAAAGPPGATSGAP
jgi:hypothetical protein